ncbi:sensor histidine kinase [Castellaniella sp.]|uniref:sensor histidine kinase n=1 Tax=Castellaniella sp. TaxID=1955812 RepID=UPI002AFE2BC4|nr:sensor histidine kinase [Castellaniella sp.]
MRPRAAAWLGCLLWAWILAIATPALASVPLQAQPARVSLAGQLEYFRDATQAMSLAAVQQQRFQRLPDFRSLGYSDDAVWFRVQVKRLPGAPLRWILAVGLPELEEVDVWVQNPEGDFVQYAMGYYRPFEDRPLQTRLFAVPFDAGAATQLYLRVRSHNAINVQADLWQPAAFSAHQTRDNFYRGLYFGILLLSVVLYAILGIRLRDVPMAAYAGYVASLLLFHLGTNGYLPVLFSRDGDWLADILPRIGWLGGAVSIVLMWDYLLDLRQRYPRIHRLYWFTLLLNLGLLPFALMPALVGAWLMVIVKLANGLNSLNFIIGMTIALILWRRHRQTELMVYFIAFIIPAVGTLVNTVGNLGYLSQNLITTNLYQAASLAHVLIMSYGMALRLRQLQRDKADARQEAAMAIQRTEEQRRFVAMLSHEFHNPLAAIDRSVQMIQLKVPDLLQSEAKRLTRIRTNVAILSRFVDNFLLVEALEHQGNQGVASLSQGGHRGLAPISPMLENIVDQQNPEDAPRVRLQVIPPGLVFSLDEALVGAAVDNLVTNALRYSSAAAQVDIRAWQDASGLHIQVQDYGPGLDQETLAMLGTPYFRAGTSLGKKGSGLGYYFAQRIVKIHGGTLHAHSPQGQGLTVEMVLPAGESAPYLP